MISYNQIMNIPITKDRIAIEKEVGIMEYGDPLLIAYKLGHRDARHAAANLIARQESEQQDSADGKFDPCDPGSNMTWVERHTEYFLHKGHETTH